MTHQRPLLGLFAACLLIGVDVAGAQAQTPSPAQMMALRPRVSDVSYTTPTAEELTQCKVEALRGAGGRSIGWMVVDGQGKTLRRFLDTNGDSKIDLWSFYKDGVEVYREIDSRNPGVDRPDQFRWLNEGGMKWGVDTTGKGKIDAWRMISSDEVSQEAFYALAARDYNRLQALMISEIELRSLKLSQSEMDRIKAQLTRAPTKFINSANLLKAGAQFVRVESAPPSCSPGDSIGMDSDLIHYKNRLVLYETNGPAGKGYDWMHTGEMIQVGAAWRLVDAPGETIETETMDPKLAKIKEEIDKIDQEGPMPFRATNLLEVNRLMRRIAKVEELLGLISAQEREGKIEELLDNLFAVAYKEKFDSLATSADPKTPRPAMTRLGQLKNQLTQKMPGTNLAAHAVFCDLSATYLPPMESPIIGGIGIAKLQGEWHDALTKFVADYPAARDTPDVLNYLAVGNEFAGKVEEAKRWYRQIYTNFPTHPLAEKARGCVRRLESIGQPMELVSPTLDGKNNFNITSLKGKVVAVYYWASFCQACPREFAVLKQLHDTLHSKGLELVCVNLDDTPAKATAFLTTNPLPGIHLFQPSKTGDGLNSPLAIHYGINGMPALFLIGRDGKVVSHTLQAFDLEDAVKNQL